MAQLYTESTALLKVLQHLGFPFNLMRAGYFVPRFIRDFLYRVVALNRYRLFGKTQYCLIPSSENKRHFLEELSVTPKPVFIQPLRTIQLTLACYGSIRDSFQKSVQSPAEISIWQNMGFELALARSWLDFPEDVKCYLAYAF